MKRLLASIFATAGVALGLLLGLGTDRPISSQLDAPYGFTLPWADSDRTAQPPQFCPPWQGDVQAPEENRGEEYRKWLRYSVRIRNGNISGSGTICYYDPQKKTAWVISCGHLFRGGEKTCQIHVFYKNNEKLAKPQTFEATILCWSPNQGGEDLSFMTFQPDWDIDVYAPIAKVDHPIIPGNTYYSCGCDGAREVACYLMKAKGIEGRNLVLTENGPRHGRSGGGLMTADGWFIGVCWGSTDPYNGTGKGLFVPLSRIHSYAKANNLGWLLEVGMAQQSPARQLRIINWTGPQRTFPPDYIPLPP